MTERVTMAHPSAPGSELVLAGFLGVLGRTALALAVADLAAASAEAERLAQAFRHPAGAVEGGRAACQHARDTQPMDVQPPW
jgi:hypothetical protein